MTFSYDIPKAIIIVGASRDQNKFGNRAARAYKDAGATVYPINPKAEKIEGLESYKTVGEVPVKKTTIATIYTPPEVTAKILPDLATYGIKTIFFNPGAETLELVEQARKLGMEPLLTCSVRAIGKDPADYAPDN